MRSDHDLVVSACRTPPQPLVSRSAIRRVGLTIRAARRADLSCWPRPTHAPVYRQRRCGVCSDLVNGKASLAGQRTACHVHVRAAARIVVQRRNIGKQVRVCVRHHSQRAHFASIDLIARRVSPRITGWQSVVRLKSRLEDLASRDRIELRDISFRYGVLDFQFVWQGPDVPADQRDAGGRGGFGLALVGLNARRSCV